jgi:hypothetical protein
MGTLNLEIEGKVKVRPGLALQKRFLHRFGESARDIMDLAP